MFLVLIIEDDAGTQRAYCARCWRSQAIALLKPTTGERGVIEARSHRPDLIYRRSGPAGPGRGKP